MCVHTRAHTCQQSANMHTPQRVVRAYVFEYDNFCRGRRSSRSGLAFVGYLFFGGAATLFTHHINLDDAVKRHTHTHSLMCAQSLCAGKTHTHAHFVPHTHTHSIYARAHAQHDMTVCTRVNRTELSRQPPAPTVRD